MESLKGHLLIASPHLRDPNFARSVVLLIHHSEDGTFGLVLNTPADGTIRDLWSQVAETPCETDQSLHVGGPVSGPLMSLHTNKALAEVEVIPGLYFAASRENLEKLIAMDDQPYRVFIGHSGWSEGQLEDELREGSWLTMPATIETVFCDEGEVWRLATNRVGEDLLSSMLHVGKIPPNTELN